MLQQKISEKFLVKIIVAVLVFASVSTILGVAGYSAKNKSVKIQQPLCKNNFDCPSQMKCKNYVCIDVGCLKEGESPPGAINPDDKKHMAIECCRDLKSIEIIKVFNEDCISMGWLGGSGKVCSNCGNGICEEWESKCNCPKDCE